MENLVQYRLSKKELTYILSPGPTSQKNTELFGTHSKSQTRFSLTLKERDLEISGDLPKHIIESLHHLNEKLLQLKKEYPEFKRTKDKAKLDFDIAKIVHETLQLKRVSAVNYDFWRWVTLNHFIEHVRWRWVNDPDNIDKLFSNSKAIFQRAFGERDRRIDLLRYWFLGERLYDKNKGYYFLEKISEKSKSVEGPFQDFINYVIDTDLFSPNDQVIKIMAEIMLIESCYKTPDFIGSFKRYNAFKNRFLIEADKDIFQKEICKKSDESFTKNSIEHN